MFITTLAGSLVFTYGVFWCAMHVVSLLSGWQKVARQFPANRPPGGARFNIQSVSLRGINYNNCLTIYRDDFGLHVYPWLPFRVAHPPLLIPWTEIHNPVESKFLGMRFVTVDIGNPRLTRLQVSAKVFDVKQA